MTHYSPAMVISSGVQQSPPTTGCKIRVRSKGWVELPPLKYARAAGAATAIDSAIVVVGGVADGQLVPQTEIFSEATRSWTDGEPIPTPRQQLAAGTDARYLYAVGG
jgi:hypothetical protein